MLSSKGVQTVVKCTAKVNNVIVNAEFTSGVAQSAANETTAFTSKGRAELRHGQRGPRSRPRTSRCPAPSTQAETQMMISDDFRCCPWPTATNWVTRFWETPL